MVDFAETPHPKQVSVDIGEEPLLFDRKKPPYNFGQILW